MKKSVLAVAVIGALSTNAFAWYSVSDNQAVDGIYQDGEYVIDGTHFEAIKEKTDGDLYLGSLNSSEKVADSTLTLDTGESWSVDVFGGGWAQSSNGEAAGDDVIRKSGNATINLKSGTISGTVFAGGNSMSGSDGYTGNYRTETGDVTINVDGATVSEAIVGGAKIRTNVANGHATSSVGNVTVNMNSGTVSGIVGGNLINTVGTSTALVVEGSTKDITINVNGGTIDKVAKGSSSSSVSISNTNFDAAIIGGNVSSIYASSVDNDSHKHTRIGSTGAITINIAKGSSVNGSIIAGSVISGKNTGVDNSSAAKATVNVYGEVLGDVVLGGAVVNGDENAVAPTTGEATIYVGEGAVIETIVAGDRKQDGATETSVANDSAKSIVFSSQNVSVDAIDTVGDKEGKNVKIVGTDTFNDSFASAEDAVAWMQSINGMEDGQAFTLQEGLVNDAVVVTPEGVQYKKNALMQDALDLAVAAPAQITRILTNDVRKRLGDLRSAQGVYGVWARYDGGKMSDDSDFEVDFNTIQVGFDTQPTPDAVRYGVAFSYTKGDTDLGRGEADMDAYSLAVYGTKFFDNGMFFDVIGRLATVDSDLEVTSAIQGNLDNRVLSLSGEFGWRFDVTKQLYVEPQVEVTYTYIDGESFTLGNATYEQDTTNSFVGRLGMAAGFKCPKDMGDVYLRASVLHEFAGDAEINAHNGIASNVASVDGKDTWFEFGLGANFNVNKNAYVYADVERSAGAELDTDWRATVGVRYSF